MNPIQRVTMTIPEAAARLGISRKSAYEAARRGDSFPVKRIGGKILVPIAAFDAWLSDRDAA